MSKRKEKKLPATVFVYWSEDGEYLLAGETVDGIDHGTLVGVYGIASTARVCVSTELV